MTAPPEQPHNPASAEIICRPDLEPRQESCAPDVFSDVSLKLLEKLGWQNKRKMHNMDLKVFRSRVSNHMLWTHAVNQAEYCLNKTVCVF